MEVPVYSLAERDRRWVLARNLMAAEDVDALIAYGGHACAGASGFAPDAYLSNDLLERLAAIAASRQPACWPAEGSPGDSTAPHTESM